MFQEELDFFIRNQDHLVKQFYGQTLVLKGKSVLAVYKTPLEAYLQIEQDQELGKVMIQRCLPGPEAYTIYMV